MVTGAKTVKEEGSSGEFSGFPYSSSKLGSFGPLQSLCPRAIHESTCQEEASESEDSEPIRRLRSSR